MKDTEPTPPGWKLVDMIGASLFSITILYFLAHVINWAIR